MDFVAEQIPPKLQEVVKMLVARRRVHLLARRVEMLRPRLRFTDEVNNFDIRTEPKMKQKLTDARRTSSGEIYFLNAGMYE